MGSFFIRKGELIIGNSQWTHPELTINFDVPFDVEPDPNISKILIYNLSNDSVTNIQRGDNVTLNAGYEDDTGNIIAGVVYEIQTIDKGLDRVAEIKCIDVSTQFMNTFISKTYSENTNAETILKDLFSLIGVAPSKLELIENKIYKNGFVATGKIKDLLKRISSDCGSQLIINNSSIGIYSPITGIETGYLLNKETGLLNINKIDKNDEQAQYRVEMLLNHNISTKSLIQIDSSTFRGLAMVIRGKHKDWKTIMEVVTIG